MGDGEMMTVTKQFTFAYAHFLPGHEGACANLHGHTGILEIEVGVSDRAFAAKPDGTSTLADNMIVDFSDLKSLVQDCVISKIDHTCLNEVFPEHMPPTAENIVVWVRQQLGASGNPDVYGFLTRIRCYETPTSWAEWRKT